jgi:transcriptional regulator with XRE-family HTH domain
MEARYRVKTARLAASLTQRELAERAGISQSLVAQIERGEREPGRNALRGLAEALGTNVSWLLGEPITEPDGDCALPSWLAGLISDGQSPPGLNALASDLRLVAVLGITDVEWRSLT